MAWGCVICGIASHTSRTLLFGAGIDLITGTLAGSLAAGLLAWLLTRRFHAPQAAFAFPGVVALVPGAYSFRAIIGSLTIAHGTASPALISETLSLAFSAVLMVAGVVIGIAAPALLPRRSRSGAKRHRSPQSMLSKKTRPDDTQPIDEAQAALMRDGTLPVLIGEWLGAAAAPA